MKIKLITALFASAILAGCANTSDSNEAMVVATGPMVDCNLPTVENDRGPIRPTLYVVGTFYEGQWMHIPSRAMAYKGDGIYQAVVNETAGTKNLQFATISWKPQFTAAGRTMNIGEEKELKKGGFQKDTVVNIAQDGQYVWSIKISEDKQPISAVIAQCK